MRPDLFEAPDYYLLDELLTEEHKLVRDATRDWVKRDVSPIIEDYAQKAEFPTQIVQGLAEIGAFGPYIPTEYGGAGLDQISYGLMMMEIERGDSGGAFHLFRAVFLGHVPPSTRTALRSNAASTCPSWPPAKCWALLV